MLKLVYTAGGKLLHARGAATENALSPKVDRRTGRTITVDVANERRLAAALDVSYPTDTLGEIRRSRADETAVRQDTQAESYTL